MAGRPTYRGCVNAETAKLVEEVLKEKGQIGTAEGQPFNIITCDDHHTIQAVKDEAEKVLADANVVWGKAIVTQKWSESVPGSRRGGTPGLVALSAAGTLPWGEKCERGGIYTWDQVTFWNCEEGCYLLSFTIKEK